MPQFLGNCLWNWFPGVMAIFDESDLSMKLWINWFRSNMTLCVTLRHVMHRLFSKPISYKYWVRRINTGNNLKDMQVLNCWDQNFVEYSMLQNNFIHLSMIWELIQVTMSLIFNIGLLWAVIQIKWDIELTSRLTEAFATIWSLIYPFIWMFWKFATMSHSKKHLFLLANVKFTVILLFHNSKCPYSI